MCDMVYVTQVIIVQIKQYSISVSRWTFLTYLVGKEKKMTVLILLLCAVIRPADESNLWDCVEPWMGSTGRQELELVQDDW